ncbi:MAG: 50S ribosomal protein L4 [Desulfarculales bacterium]|jgi:large subunit ribosomal protein L4|nr:50S ribosomal protein L4 [Desulfarculales bacterium]
MPTLEVYSAQREQVGEINLSETVFGAEVKTHLLHEVVVWQLACRRQGTAKVKTRGEVRGGSKKPWRQKGTGRARSGSRRSPLWRGGGVIFGPQPRDYSYTVPKKVRKAALRMALSDKLNEHKILVLRGFDLDEIKTRNFLRVLDRFAVKKTLVITGAADENLEKSARNVPGVKVLRSEGLNVYDILRYDNLILLEGAVGNIEESLA